MALFDPPVNPFSAVSSWSARHPFWAVPLVLLVAVAAAAGMSQAEPGRIGELFVPDDLPALDVQRQIEVLWGEQEAAFFLYLVDDPTDPDLLRAVAHDQARLAALDSVDAVIGLPTLLAQQLGDLDAASDAQIQGAASNLFGTEAGRPFIVEDALLVRATFPPADDLAAQADALRAVAQESKSLALGADLRPAGVLFVEEYQQESAGGDVAFLMPLSLVVIILVLSLLFRRVQDVAVPLVTVLVAVAMAYGTVAWAGLALAPPSFIVMPLLLGLGIDYMLHIIYAYREQPASQSLDQRFVEVGREVGYPVFFTALTTLIGFGSFLVSNIPQIRTWGLLIGSGALYAFLLGFTLLPALYRIRRAKPRNTRLPLQNVMAAMTTFVMSRRRSVLAVMLVATAGLMVSAANVDVQDYIDFEPDSDAPAVANLNEVQDRFGGQLMSQFLIDASSGDRDDLEAFEFGFEDSPYAGFVDGPLHRLQRAGTPDAPLVGAATQGVATNSYWLVTVGYVFEDQDAALDDFEARAEGSTLDVGVTGPGVLERESRETFLNAVAKSTVIALVLVVVLLLLVFRHPIAAGLAFLPLLLAVGWQLGIMNLVGIPINPITGVMTAMIIGVGVDYSLHIMAHFQTARKAGQASFEAASGAMKSVGRPVLAATLTTVFAFSVLAFSSLSPLRDFGIVAAIAVASAFLISLTILPILASYAPPLRRVPPPKPINRSPIRPRFVDPDVEEWFQDTMRRR